MTVPGGGGETGETDEPSIARRTYRTLVRGVRWLREFNRGYASTGHLPNRKD